MTTCVSISQLPTVSTISHLSRNNGKNITERAINKWLDDNKDNLDLIDLNFKQEVDFQIRWSNQQYGTG
jgi:hypothetical protein